MNWWQIKKRDADLARELRSDLELEEEEQTGRWRFGKRRSLRGLARFWQSYSDS